MTELVPLPDESPFDRIKQTRPDGSEFWSARQLQSLMAYTTWDRFSNPLHRAMQSASNMGADVDGLFRRSAKKTGGRDREDYELSRQAAYLVAMNGDPNKPEVAAAQQYFAARTIQAESVEQAAKRELTRLELIDMARESELARIEAEKQLAIAAPKAEYVDVYVKGDEDASLLRVVANQLQVGEKSLREFLVNQKVIYRRVIGTRWSHSKGRMVTEYEYQPHAKFKAWFKVGDQPEAPRAHNGQMRTTLYVTPVGKVKIAELVRARGVA